MRTSSLLAALAAGGLVSATPSPKNVESRTADVNPFQGKTQFVNPKWADKLDQTLRSFLWKGDVINAGKVLKIQHTMSTFVWVSKRADLSNIDQAIATARRTQRLTGKKQIVGLVLYNLPDRDCSAGESAGELHSDENGLQLYKDEFIKPYAEKVAAAKDLTFAIVLEPDSLGNAVTNMGIELCAKYDHVNLYIDAAHGGWLGWDGNLPLAAKEFAGVVKLAGEGKKIRGFAINVSNYNPFNAAVRENYTEWSNSWDESHYATSLAPHLEAEGLPAHFIVDQGRVHLPGARKEWGEWCNVHPAGFGPAPSTKTNNTVVDALVWIKPGGESDGQCGMAGATKAGEWFDEYAQMLVKNADLSVFNWF
ncbi:1,4-beta-D-glucan cellobiohydrolase cel6b [Collariella sp. IMI 366227]|nr:1,4-beta-D-glucan cellobiohydrolase cel6b [Collariella sp. IMI 366227]